MEGGFGLAVIAPFPVDPLDPDDPVDPDENSGRLVFDVIYKVFCTFSRKMITIFEVAALGALLAPR